MLDYTGMPPLLALLALSPSSRAPPPPLGPSPLAPPTHRALASAGNYAVKHQFFYPLKDKEKDTLDWLGDSDVHTIARRCETRLRLDACLTATLLSFHPPSSARHP